MCQIEINLSNKLMIEFGFGKKNARTYWCFPPKSVIPLNIVSFASPTGAIHFILMRWSSPLFHKRWKSTKVNNIVSLGRQWPNRMQCKNYHIVCIYWGSRNGKYEYQQSGHFLLRMLRALLNKGHVVALVLVLSLVSEWEGVLHRHP